MIGSSFIMQYRISLEKIVSFFGFFDAIDVLLVVVGSSFPQFNLPGSRTFHLREWFLC